VVVYVIVHLRNKVFKTKHNTLLLLRSCRKCNSQNLIYRLEAKIKKFYMKTWFNLKKSHIPLSHHIPNRDVVAQLANSSDISGGTLGPKI
jgi:hypothetical protein